MPRRKRRRAREGEDLSTCNAKTRAGGRCIKAPMANGRCYFHGGASLVGPANPAFKTGKYSEVLPEGWRTTYERLRRDPDLLELREEIALCDMLLAEQARRLGSADAAAVGQLLIEANTATSELRTTIRTLEPEQRAWWVTGVMPALENLEKILSQGVSEERRRQQSVKAEHEVRRTLGEKRKLADTEVKRAERMQAYVTVEHLTALAYRFADMAQGLVARLTAELQALGSLPEAQVDLIARRVFSSFAAELQAQGEAEPAPPKGEVN